MGKRRSFTQMLKEDLDLLKLLPFKRKKDIAINLNMTPSAVSERIRQIRKRYRRWRRYINGITSLIGQYEQVKAAMLIHQPEPEILEEEDLDLLEES